MLLRVGDANTPNGTTHISRPDRGPPPFDFLRWLHVGFRSRRYSWSPQSSVTVTSVASDRLPQIGQERMQYVGSDENAADRICRRARSTRFPMSNLPAGRANRSPMRCSTSRRGADFESPCAKAGRVAGQGRSSVYCLCNKRISEFGDELYQVDLSPGSGLSEHLLEMRPDSLLAYAEDRCNVGNTTDLDNAKQDAQLSRR